MINKLGKTIRILRQAKDMTLSEVAKVSGISVAFLSLVESGGRHPSLEVVQRLGKSLGVPADALMAMGMQSDSVFELKTKETQELAETVDRLVEIEKKLSRLLNTEVSGAAKRRQSRTRRGGDVPKPR